MNYRFTHFHPSSGRAFFVAALSLTFSIALLLPGCKTDDFKDFDQATIQQEGAYAFAVATINFTLADLLEDDTTLTVGADNGIHLRHREEHFFTLNAREVLDDITGDINESFSHSTTVGVVSIDDIMQSSSLAFSTLLDDFNDAAMVDYLTQNEGSQVLLPAFEENITSEENIPAFTDFTSLTIEEGALSLTITNHFFFDIEELSLEIIDIGNGQSVGTFQFDYIDIGESKTSEISLAGNMISNEFKVIVSTLKTPGSGANFVTVDLQSQLDITFESTDVKIKEGVVNLPAGILAENEINFDLNTDNGEQITKLQLQDALVSYEITSELATDILVRVTFPDVTRNNAPLVQEFTVSPTSTNGPQTGTLDFSNTSWSLDNDPGQPFNRLKALYEVSLPGASGGQIPFSAEDQVTLLFNLSGLQVTEAIGYFGFQQEQFEPNSLDLGFDFSLFAEGSGPLLFSDPKMHIEINNSFGIPLQGQFNATAVGYFGETANLNPPKIVINYPTQAEIGQSVSTAFVINKNNSNLVEMLSVYPSTINYDGAAMINPANDPSIVNFVRSDSRLDASVEFDLPFKFSAQNLLYRDTSVAADLGLEQGGFTIEDIDSAEMKIVYDNGLPLASTISLIALDKNGNEAVVLENIHFDAAVVDNNGRVTPNGITRGVTFVLLTTEQLLTLDNADRYIYEIAFSSQDNGQTPVAMYTDYQVEMGLGIRLVVSRE